MKKFAPLLLIVIGLLDVVLTVFLTISPRCTAFWLLRCFPGPALIGWGLGLGMNIVKARAPLQLLSEPQLEAMRLAAGPDNNADLFTKRQLTMALREIEALREALVRHKESGAA